jgi:FKBP12-rapamycin complex-associated protein
MAQDDPLKETSTRQMTAPLTMLGLPAEEYFQTVVMSALLNILHDGALGTQYFGVIEVIMTIFKTQGLKCTSFLPQVFNLSALPHFGQLTLL